MKIETEQKGYNVIQATTNVPTRRTYPQQFQIVFNALREKCIEQHSKDPKLLKGNDTCLFFIAFKIVLQYRFHSQIKRQVLV